MKSRPNLFEVMNKAPQTHTTIRTPKLPFFGGLKKGAQPSTNSSSAAAQALTEEEAAAELTARRAAIEAAERAKAEALERVAAAKEAKRLARLERKVAKQAAREAARQRSAELAAQKAASAAESVAKRPILAAGRSKVSWFRAASGRFSFSLSTAGCLAVAGMFCSLVAGAYLLGHRTGGDNGSPRLTPAAAILASDLQKQHASGGESDALQKASSRVATGRKSGKSNPELEELMAPPAAVLQNVMANQPQRLDSAQEGVAVPAKKLNHVQIDWFQITVEKSSEDLLADLTDVHRFLKSKGIETFARELPRGFILYSAKGYSMSDKARSERNAFLKTIEQLGQEYFRGGGRYQFKDCFFVSHGNAMKGRPVSFKE